eukprot:1873212-Rhodomonas_salina.1
MWKKENGTHRNDCRLQDSVVTFASPVRVYIHTHSLTPITQPDSGRSLVRETSNTQTHTGNQRVLRHWRRLWCV